MLYIHKMNWVCTHNNFDDDSNTNAVVSVPVDSRRTYRSNITSSQQTAAIFDKLLLATLHKQQILAPLQLPNSVI